MVLGLLLTSAGEVAIWTVRKTIFGVYYGTKYLFYGHQKSETELLREEIDELKDTIKELTVIIKNDGQKDADGSEETNEN